ncbi:phosphonate ABC transporter, permease protein PhnE [Candidatus Izemoplasma sp. B36]|uniref:phosphonate ABC transporter, permease protein PhnE n=1 Tax=Candidatus Izemoplasma sp. B36 TaxID=3242468 RepID=UPI003558F6A6
MLPELKSKLPTRPSRVKLYSNIILITLIIISSAWFAGFDVIDIFRNFFNGFDMIGRLFFWPDWAYTDNLLSPLLETIQMAIMGSVVGAVVAFPAALLAANNFIEIKWLNKLMRFILNIFRTIPSLVLASLFVAVFGRGSFPGILALSIFSFGLISKMTYESIEAIDYGQVEALTSLGASKMEILRYSILPQVLPQFMSYTLYAFEVNVRAAAVLGYVGAGGIGQTYQIWLDMRRFDRIGMIIIISFVAVLIIDFISSSIRRKLV